MNKAFNVLCSQSLYEVVVRSCCREVQSKSSVAFRVVMLPFWNLLLPLPYLIRVAVAVVWVTVNIMLVVEKGPRDIYCLAQTLLIISIVTPVKSRYFAQYIAKQ